MDLSDYLILAFQVWFILAWQYFTFEAMLEEYKLKMPISLKFYFGFMLGSFGYF